MSYKDMYTQMLDFWFASLCDENIILKLRSSFDKNETIVTFKNVALCTGYFYIPEKTLSWRQVHETSGDAAREFAEIFGPLGLAFGVSPENKLYCAKINATEIFLDLAFINSDLFAGCGGEVSAEA